MTNFIESWNRGYESLGFRTLQSVGISALVIGALALYVGIEKGFNSHAFNHALDNRIFQLILAATAGVLIKRTVKLRDLIPSHDLESKKLRALESLAILIFLNGLAAALLAIYAGHQGINCLDNYRDMFNNQTFKVIALSAETVLVSLLLCRAVKLNKKAKESRATESHLLRTDTYEGDLTFMSEPPSEMLPQEL